MVTTVYEPFMGVRVKLGESLKTNFTSLQTSVNHMLVIWEKKWISVNVLRTVSCGNLVWAVWEEFVETGSESECRTWQIYCIVAIKLFDGATRGQKILTLTGLRLRVFVCFPACLVLSPPPQALNPKPWLHSGTSWPNGWARQGGPRPPCRMRFMNWTEQPLLRTPVRWGMEQGAGPAPWRCLWRLFTRQQVLFSPPVQCWCRSRSRQVSPRVSNFISTFSLSWI